MKRGCQPHSRARGTRPWSISRCNQIHSVRLKKCKHNTIILPCAPAWGKAHGTWEVFICTNQSGKGSGHWNSQATHHTRQFFKCTAVKWQEQSTFICNFIKWPCLKLKKKSAFGGRRQRGRDGREQKQEKGEGGAGERAPPETGRWGKEGMKVGRRGKSRHLLKQIFLFLLIFVCLRWRYLGDISHS